MDPHHVDADPDSTSRPDSDPDSDFFYADPDFYLLLIWIRYFTLMQIRIQILASK
jgi:hypothetical protein